MRILMLAQFYAPIVGGEERHVQDLSRALVARGHEVAVATLWQEGLPDFELDQGVRIHRIRSSSMRVPFLFKESGRRHVPPIPDPELTMSLRRVIAREKPDVVHAHNWLVHSFIPLKPFSGAKLIVTLHDFTFACAKKRLMYHDAPCTGPGLLKCLECAGDHYGKAKGAVTTLSNWFMQVPERAVVDMFLPVSEATAIGNGLPGSGLPYRVLPNFVPDDIGVFGEDADPRLSQLPAGDFMLFVGDNSRDKGVHILLRAYAEMKHAPPLVLLGRKVAEDLEMPPNVIQVGPWPHEAVMQAWRRSMLGFAPSVWMEPFGIVVIEAMAAGRPVIASRIGGISDIVVDGQTGLLVPPGDHVALRQATERLLADPELRARMGQAGRDRVAMFTANNVVTRIEQTYEDMLKVTHAGKNGNGGDRNGRHGAVQANIHMEKTNDGQ